MLFHLVTRLWLLSVLMLSLVLMGAFLNLGHFVLDYWCLLIKECLCNLTLPQFSCINKHWKLCLDLHHLIVGFNS